MAIQSSADAIEGSRTSQFGRFLLMATIMLLPLQDHFTDIGGFGFMFFAFGMLAVYTIMNGVHVVDRVWLHPVFITAYLFCAVSALLEFASPESTYDEILRFGLMVVGALCVASLCRDRRALQACLYAYIGAALWLGVVLFLTSYGALQGVAVNNFTEASLLRADVLYKKVPVGANPNGMAFNCLQGGVVAFAFAVAETQLRRRNIFLAIASFCWIASCLAMSRASIAVGIASCAVIFYIRGLTNLKSWILAGMLGLCMIVFVPSAVWTRFDTGALSTEGDVEEMESRVALLVLAMRNLPDYVFTGVGVGNSLRTLGEWSTSVHNSFLQITINWGLIGLSAFLMILWQAFKCLPRRCGNDELALALAGLVISIFMVLFFIHNFNEKFFAFGFGMLVASRCWIWPRGTTVDDGQDKLPAFSR